MNCGEIIPPLVRVRPEINPEDGILDLITISADFPWQGLRGLFRVISTAVAGKSERPRTPYARGTRFTVEAADTCRCSSTGIPPAVRPSAPKWFHTL
jgi:hypothetical protein